ncbi:hypothetical protein [uncultured Methanobrevibacter sp.]|uniref:hypothetical protein n=1 Tax=uncultured Methanobrevibacter sp. TaxID=253161 RepID=UPI0025F1140D|nr:hypothetical protein [uncultured Methanobrevibacter sp.]
MYSKVILMLSIKENKVLNETNQRNVIRAKIKALNFRLLTCVDDERQEIEEEIARLTFQLDNVTIVSNK